jgi:hypothetical protein
MASLFQTVTVAVTGLGIALTATRLFRPGAALRDLGRFGRTWFDHNEDHPLEEQPDGNVNDAPIPYRRLRGRGD